MPKVTADMTITLDVFGPDRGEWDLDWKGWWGPDPVYHAPVFVLGHRPRPSAEMEGGTTYHFVTDGIEAAPARARDKNVSIAGGERVFDDVGDVELTPIPSRATPHATHLVYRRR